MAAVMAAEGEIPDEDFDAVNADALEDETADDSPAASIEYSTEDEEVRPRFSSLVHLLLTFSCPMMASAWSDGCTGALWRACAL